MMKHLKSETDEKVKLRVALLLAINLLQQEDEIIANDFCQTMLTIFAPLAEEFKKDGTHPFCGGYRVALADDENQNLKVHLPTDSIDSLAGPNLDRSGEEG